jgi:lipopolysaccharide exporter
MAHGIVWMTAARMGVRFLGLLSTLVLARLLTPADFGLIALAMSVVKLVETLSEFGFEMPLIQKRDATRDDFDTAWTLNVMLAGIICTLIAVAAPFAARFYSEPRIEAILYFVAAGHFFLAFQNIGTVQFRRQLDFKRDFALQVAQKVCMVAVAIPLAFAVRSYWALVGGIVAGNVAAVVVSYLFLPYRPRFCLKSSRALFGFSKWIQVSSMLRYVQRSGLHPGHGPGTRRRRHRSLLRGKGDRLGGESDAHRSDQSRGVPRLLATVPTMQSVCEMPTSRRWA